MQRTRTSGSTRVKIHRYVRYCIQSDTFKPVNASSLMRHMHDLSTGRGRSTRHTGLMLCRPSWNALKAQPCARHQSLLLASVLVVIFRGVQYSEAPVTSVSSSDAIPATRRAAYNRSCIQKVRYKHCFVAASPKFNPESHN